MRRLVILLVFLPRAALADPVVLSFEHGKAIVGLGSADGVGAGTELELLHDVTVKDPVSGKTLKDTFPLGTLTVTRAGDHVAEATPEEAIATRVAVGDAVELVSESRTFVDPWQTRVTASKAAPVVVSASPSTSDDPAVRRAEAEAAVADADAARATWQATLGQPLNARIALWNDLLARDPHNRYAPAIRTEIASLEQQQGAIAEAAAAPVTDREVALADALAQLDDTAGGDGPLIASTPRAALVGQPIELAFAVRHPDEAIRGWLYARTTGQGAYQRLPLHADGDAYLRGTIPATLVAAPGVQWFVETAAATGRPAAAIGDDQIPESIAVTDVREPAPAPAGKSRVSLAVDYVDFDGGLTTGYDQYSEADLDFMYRFIHPVYAFRLGLGTLDGWGGPKDVIDLHAGCRDSANTFRCERVSYTYGYAEAEFRIKPNIALMIRPQVGKLTRSRSADVSTGDCLAGDPRTECDIGSGIGMRARLRLGEEAGTNLVLGVGATSNVGTLFEAAYTWAAAREVPIVLAVEVTDMPVPEDFGVRIVGDVGWRKLSWVYPSLRVSYQARDVDHSGFSGGLGLNFDW